MARFLCFIHGIGDIEEFRSDFPEHDFFFLSQNPIPGASAVLQPGTVEHTIGELKRLHALQPFAGIVFGSALELYVKIAHQIAEALNLRRFVSNTDAVRDKYAMRRAFAGKVACPESRVVKAGIKCSQFSRPQISLCAQTAPRIRERLRIQGAQPQGTRIRTKGHASRNGIARSPASSGNSVG